MSMSSSGSNSLDLIKRIEAETEARKSKIITVSTGVQVIYNAYAVTINIITASKQYNTGWNDIATVPEGLRPREFMPFPGIDNNTGNSVAMRVAADGKIQMWLSSGSMIACCGVITYLL